MFKQTELFNNDRKWRLFESKYESSSLKGIAIIIGILLWIDNTIY